MHLKIFLNLIMKWRECLDFKMKTHIIKLTNKNNKKLQEIKKENDLKNVDNTLNFILEKYELKKELK